MVIRKVELEHFKGFTKQELELDRNLNFFIGSNASGKTSFLHAIIKCLFQLTDRYAPIRPRPEILLPQVEDINYHHTSCKVTTYIEYEKETYIFPLRIGNSNDNDRQKDHLDREKLAKSINRKINIGPITVPIIKYFPANRTAIKYAQLQDKVYKISQLETWANLYQDNLSYSRFLHWFFENETNELRLKRDSGDYNIENINLKFVRSSLEKALKIIYGEPYIVKTGQRKRKGTNRLTPVLIMQRLNSKSKGETLEAKSDGEKSIISLIADIAYNLSLAKDYTMDEDISKSTGIVLIDEIEAHLHPNWQRKVINIITSLFPNVQFFITSHSPQVLSSVNSKHVFLCEDFKIRKASFKSKGVDSNNLLKYLFNSTERPSQYLDLINSFELIIEQNGSPKRLEDIIKKIINLEKEDTGNDINLLLSELDMRLEAYKFELKR